MRGGKLVKVCGMIDGDNIRAVESLGVDLIGFIFYPRSPRYVSGKPAYLPERAHRAGVFVDAGYDEIMRRRDAFGLEYVQLHGSESPELGRRLRAEGVRVIKAFGLDADARALPLPGCEWEDACDLYLFDTRTDAYGGSGRSFDWQMLDRYEGRVPFLLSGGIGHEMKDELKAIVHKAFIGIDLNSRFELAPGVKDVSKLAAFLVGLF
jgi:phosphoribosylanthranilate isomerase